MVLGIIELPPSNTPIGVKDKDYVVECGDRITVGTQIPLGREWNDPGTRDVPCVGCLVHWIASLTSAAMSLVRTALATRTLR